MTQALMQWKARPGEPARNPSDIQIRLICFPHAGGGASAFRTWQKALPASIEVMGVILPGREKRFQEAPVPSVEALVPALADAIARLSDRKIALFGHSLGGIIAFEVARRLFERHNIQPAHLIIAAAPAPEFFPPADQFHHIKDDATFIQALSALGGMQRDILEAQELLNMLLPVIRADIEAFETYSCINPIKMPWPVSVLGGQDDGTIKPEELSGWQSHAGGSFSLEYFPGDHFFVQSAEGVLLSRLAELLLNT